MSEDLHIDQCMKFATYISAMRGLSLLHVFTLNSLNAHGLVNHTLLQDYPKSNDSMINSELETDMQTILKIVELGRSIRNAKNMKVKQPLQQIIVWRSNGERFLSAYTAIIKDELIVKDVVYTEDISQYESNVFKFNFKTAGAAFGKLVNSIKEYVDHITDNEKKVLLDHGQLQIEVKNQTVILKKEHINVEYIVSSGFEIAGDQQLRVLLDIKTHTSTSGGRSSQRIN